MELNYKTVYDLDLRNKLVILRLDLNVPIFANKILDQTRIDASLPTVQYLLDQNDKIVILSHLGRIYSIDDINDNTKSLLPVVKLMQEKLPGVTIKFCASQDLKEIAKQVSELQPKEILVLENTRYFNIDANKKLVNLESEGKEELAKFYASLGDVYINDAFATVHRDHASNAQIAKYQPINAIGLLMQKELSTLSKILDHPQHPFVAIFGGGKVKDKIPLIEKLLDKADKVIISGGLTYTFAKAMGHNVGISKTEDELFDTVRKILKSDKKHKIVLADDAMCVPAYADTPGKPIDIGSKEFEGVMGLDIGPKTAKKYEKVLEGAKTIFYNGPLGVTEFVNFQQGTKSLFDILAKLVKKGAKVVIGGGDSASAAVNFGYKDKFTFISTGGGASMGYLEGKDLPGLAFMDKKGLTPHIGAPKDKIAKVVIMCGDPLRAKWMAETFLTNYTMVTNIRGMMGFSGYYKKHFVTIMGHGMGIPSIGIYSYELFKFYDVQLIVRLGTAGALKKDIRVGSLLLAKEVYSESNYVNELGLKVPNHILKLNPKLKALAQQSATKLKINLIPANIITTDCFYTVIPAAELSKKDHCAGVEMESFGLYANARKLRKHAISILTVSDNAITNETMPAINRQISLVDMSKLGLEIIKEYLKNSL